MRLLQLEMGQDELLDLHPNLTVVQGLDADARHVLVDAVRGLARAEASAGGGLLEAHGVLFELSPDLLGLLELDLPEVDPVVRPGDLPTQPLTVDAQELRRKEAEFSRLLEEISAQAERQSQARGAIAAATAAVEQARQALADAESGGERRLRRMEDLTGHLDGLAEHRRQVESAQRDIEPAIDEATTTLRELQARTDEVRATAREAAVRLAELEAERDVVAVDRDDGAAAALDGARTALADLTAAIEAERAAADAAAATPKLFEEQPRSAEPPQVQLERIEARLAEISRTAAALAAVDPDRVAEALAILRNGGAGPLIPSAEALALADDLDEIDRQVGADDGELVVEGSLAEARERLDDARQSLLEAEQAVRNPELDRAEVGRLEKVHEELLEAIERADGRFAGNRARQRVDRLRAAEQEVLDRLGFASYTDYVMGSSLLHADPEKELALDVARVELAAAEDGWRRMEAATEAALARAALLDRRRGLIESARRLVGGQVAPDELTGALRSLRVPEVSAAQAADRLRAALDVSGMDLGDEQLDRDEIALLAEAWLAESVTTDERMRLLREEHATLVAAQPALRAAAEAEPDGGYTLSALGPESDGRDAAEADRAARLAAAQRRVSEAEERWLADAVAEERMGALESGLAAASEAAAAATEAAARAEEEVAQAAAGLDSLHAREVQLAQELTSVAEAEAEATLALEQVSSAQTDPATLAAAVEAAEAQARTAEHVLEAETRALASLDAEGQAAAIEIERLQDIVASQDGGGATEAEELEWYLLARLAAQRAVSVAGSLPMVLDDALRGLDTTGVDHLLGRLERMADAVQVIVVSEDPVVADWAREAGPARAAVVRPGVP